MRLAKRTSNLFRPRDADRRRGLDVSGLDGVISVDAEARTADVQGMCTYEDLVDATLPHGLIPLVVPQLRTITLGGAVTGLGIESTSFRNGLPHESVLEMDVFTGAGEVRHVHARQRARRPVRDVPQLLRLARLRHPAAHRARAGRRPTSPLRHVRFTDTDGSARTRSPTITETREWHGERVDALDGTVFEPGEYYLTLGRWTRASRRPGQRLRRPADLLALDPAARDRPAHDLRLPLALGHRLVLVLAGLRRAEPARASVLAAALAALRRLPQAASASTGASASPTGSTGAPAGRSASG